MNAPRLKVTEDQESRRTSEYGYAMVFGPIPYLSVTVDMEGVTVGIENSTGTDSTTVQFRGPIDKFVLQDSRPKEWTTKEQLKENIIKLHQFYISIHRTEQTIAIEKSNPPLMERNRTSHAANLLRLQIELKQLHDECNELEHAVINKIDSMKE